jgi:hypothetical protein
MSEAVLLSADEQARHMHAWQVWDIVKQELLYLCWALMEIALLTPVALSIVRWARFWPEGQLALWLLLLMLLPFNLARLLSALQIGEKTQRRIMAAALLLTLLFSWRFLLFSSHSFLDLSWLSDLYSNLGESSSLWTRTLTLFLLIIFTWWRGLRLVQIQPDLHKTGLRLRLGIVLFIPVSLLPLSRPSAWGFLPFVLLFLLAGLMVVALIRAEQIERERSGFAASLSPRWVGTIAAASLLVVLIAGLFAVLVSGETLTLLSQWLSPVRMAILAATWVALATAFYLASPLLYVFNIVLTWLSRLFATLFAGFGENISFETGILFDLFDGLLPPQEDAAEATAFSIPPEVVRGLIVFTMIILVILVAYSLTRRFRQMSFSARNGGPIRTAGNSRSDAEGLGQSLLQRLGILRRWRTAASIRQLYMVMCDSAADMGRRRAPSETPYEYLHTLTEVWPANQQETRLITEAYIRVRYGEIPETEAELEAIKEAWRRLEAAESVGIQERS